MRGWIGAFSRLGILCDDVRCVCVLDWAGVCGVPEASFPLMIIVVKGCDLNYVISRSQSAYFTYLIPVFGEHSNMLTCMRFPDA
jgi:hypothetical protein